MYIVPQRMDGETMKRITKIEAKKKETRNLRVAAYARVSTSEEAQLQSLECQKTHYEQYIKSHAGWDYAGLYYDEGISGTKMEKRSGLLSMLDACERGEIDFIVVKSISRFSRNTVDSIEVVRRLCNLGIHMYFEKENLNTGEMEGEFLLSILSSLAESESRSISENNKWGIIQRFKSGTYKQSCMPYGYESDDGQFIIKEDEAEVVRQIFDSVLKGVSMRDIATQLNNEGISAPRTAKWRDSTIKSIVGNERYIGDALYQKTFNDDSFIKRKNNGQKDQYYVKNHHDAIISEEVFNAANDIVDMNAQEKGIELGTDKYLKRYAFSGKIVCGECGGKFKRIKVANRFHQACRTHINNKEVCGMKSIHEDAIKAAFVTMMNKLIFAREKILVPLERGLTSVGNEEYILRLSEIETRLDDLAEKRDKLMSFYSTGLLTPGAFANEIAAVEYEENECSNEIRDLEMRMNASRGNFAGIEELLKFTKESEMLVQFDGELFTKFVERIIVYKRTEIGFELKCGPVFRERI